ncbi:AVIToxin-VAR2-like [Notolabrus celidotus]|uniref:AVIToxin-VAR2-like n=1 Tax=Notolabrus celidotus TaxID=1203425 RepID=UPI00149065F0|nr:AVIToxin-VAR2-like [Notolabrus celidotus]
MDKTLVTDNVKQIPKKQCQKQKSAEETPSRVFEKFVETLGTLLLSPVVHVINKLESSIQYDSGSLKLQQACETDPQCREGMCCAVSLWIRSLRMCTPVGQEGDECHPLSHQIPFFGKRLHHTCPCLPNLSCVTVEEGRSRCLPSYNNPDYL